MPSIQTQLASVAKMISAVHLIPEGKRDQNLISIYERLQVARARLEQFVTLQHAGNDPFPVWFMARLKLDFMQALKAYPEYKPALDFYGTDRTPTPPVMFYPKKTQGLDVLANMQAAALLLSVSGLSMAPGRVAGKVSPQGGAMFVKSPDVPGALPRARRSTSSLSLVKLSPASS